MSCGGHLRVTAVIEMTLTSAATAMRADLLSHTTDSFYGVSTDTRQLKAGELFFALSGDRFDGHDMLEVAAAKGAAGAVIQRPMTTALPLLAVRNTRCALGDLAASWRAQHDLPVAAITGSNGKTTSKEMLAAILAQRGSVLASMGNYNNDIGVPKTLFDLDVVHRYAVVEMGANHRGEIARLCAITKPSVAVVTMCGPAHLEGFGSIADVAAAKGEIYATLESDGIAIINADDHYAPLWRELAGSARKVEFSQRGRADLWATHVVEHGLGAGLSFGLSVGIDHATMRLAVDGAHNVTNALAACACAYALGFRCEEMQRGLSTVAPVRGRLQRCAGIAGMTLVDDTYNANPSSLRAGLALLKNMSQRRWLVLGDMAELGDEGVAYHRQAGADARAAGVQRLLAVGELAAEAALAFGHGGESFASVDALVATLRAAAAPDLVVLVKASRTMRFERVVAALAAQEQASC